MPGRNNNRGGRRRRGSRRGPVNRVPQQLRELPISSVSYYGQVRDPTTRNEVTLKTLVLNSVSNFTSNGGGVISSVYSSSPSTASNWSGLASVFDEFRVLAFQISYEPNDQYDLPATTGTVPILTVLDHDNIAALTTYSQAAQYESVRMHNLSRPWTRRISMSDVAEAQFFNTATPPTSFFIKTYTQNAGVSTIYGLIMVTWRVQFRGLGV